MRKIKELHEKFSSTNIFTLPIGGLYRYRKSGKITNIKWRLIHLLQSAVGSGSYEQYKKYSTGIHNLPPINIRDLLEFKKSKKEISLDEVEPLEKILKDLVVEACHALH